MRIVEIGTGYTSIPANKGAATEIVVEELTKAFFDYKCNVDLFDIYDGNRLPNNLPITEVKIPAFFSSTDVRLGIMHKLKRVFYSIKLTKVLKKKIKNTDEKLLLHFHNQYNLYFFLKLTKKSIRENVKIAYTVHSYVWPTEWEEIKDVIHKRYFQEVFCVQNADVVLVLNDKTRENFVQHLGVSNNKICKISNGVNTNVYTLLTEEENRLFKESIGLEEKYVIFQVGSVCERKNQLGAVKMLADYLQEHRDIVYMYAGGIIDAEYKNEIDTYAKENGIESQVKYVGELCPGKQLNKYYNMANVTIFPSKIESFGLVIIESLSAGTPVILSGKPLFDLNYGYSIFDNEKEFVSLIEKNVLGQNKGEKNRSEIIEKYSWQAVAKQHLEWFNK